MAIWSELINSAVGARGGFLRGKEKGNQQRLQNELEARRQAREDADSAASRAHLERLSALRDPNDPELIRLRADLDRRNDLAVEDKRNQGSLTGELRRGMTSTMETIRAAQGQKSSAERAMRSLPSIYASPEEEARGRATRDSLGNVIAKADSTIAANQREHDSIKARLLESIGLTPAAPPKEQDPAYQAARSHAKNLYLKAIERAKLPNKDGVAPTPAEVRQRILAAKQAYSEAVAELKAEYGGQ